MRRSSLRSATGTGSSLLVLCCAWLAGCGAAGGPAGHVDGGPDSDVVTCQNDPRVDTYAPNMAKSSALNAYKIVLVESDLAPPAIGVNTWAIKVLDPAGNPFTSPLGVVPFMPDHGHGTSIKASVTALPDGTYSVTPLYLFMGGVWRIEFNPKSGTADPVDFFFCVAG